MKKFIILLMLAGVVFADDKIIVKDFDGDVLVGKLPVGEATQAQLETKLNTNQLTQTVTTNATDIPSGAAVAAQLATKADATNVYTIAETAAQLATKADTVDAVFTNSVTVTGTVVSTNGFVSGEGAATSTGTYYFAGYAQGYSDEAFPFWTNSSGRVLWDDVFTQWYTGNWSISDAGFSSSATYVFDGSEWLDWDLYEPVDIMLSQAPFYEERSGKAYVDEFHGEFYGLLKSTGNENYKIGYSAGGTNTYDYEGDYTGDPQGKGNLYIGRYSGASSRGNHNTFVGDSAGLGLGDEDVEAFSDNTCIGFSAGRSAKSSWSTFIGKGAGWGATDSYLVVLESFGSDYESKTTPTTNSMFYFQGGSVGRLLIGRPSGSIDIRGTNVITGTIVTNVVQQKDSNGFLTNVVIQGITGKIVK